MTTARNATMLTAAVLLGLLTARQAGAQTGDDALEFFEKRVRPVLAENCYRCHGPDKQKSGMRLDHIDYVLRGGERGPAIVPADAAASRLVRAVRYGDVDLQMPPKERLPDRQIEDLVRWVAIGAPWPDEPRPTDAGARDEDGFDLEQRRRDHWAWQPLEDVDPPPVGDSGWPRGAIDRFVLARLSGRGLAPARSAGRATWLRRVSFDLIGLPPTPEEVEAFCGDESDDAYETVVDRLLASPHFGERWARHWLDLVRYAETLGHEFDYVIHDAWRYRDYLIRAFNADLPYDQLILEHVAGDLLPEPRRNPEHGSDESAIGTAFWWFGDQSHSPVDVVQHFADRVDNQIDVLSKTFLGVTVACARCHDHKFDAISTADYYSLVGVLKSSRYQLTPIASMRRSGVWDEIREVRARLLEQTIDDALAATAGLPRALRAAAAVPAPKPLPRDADPAAKTAHRAERSAQIAAVAADHGVEPDRLERWVGALAGGDVARDREHPLHPWRRVTERLATGPDADLAGLWAEIVAAAPPPEPAGTAAPLEGDVVLGDAAAPDGFAGWRITGEAFRRDPVRPAVTLDAASPEIGPRLWALPGPWLCGGGDSPRLIGSLHSPTFRIDRRYLHVLVAGRQSRCNVVLEGFNVIRDPIYGRLKQHVDHTDPRWRTIDLDMWRGRSAYLQLHDLPSPDPSGRGYAPDGWIAVQRALLSDERRPPAASPRHLTVEDPLGAAPPGSLAELATRYAAAARAALVTLRRDGPPSVWHARLVNWLSNAGFLRATDAARAGETEQLRARCAELEARLPAPAAIPGMTDGTAEDERIYVRGSHRDRGEQVPRRFLEALGGAALADAGRGSGRLDLARKIADPDNPLTARVAVNRIWHHLTGRGIVATVDNLGVLGEEPTHPHLLDWLARRFVDDGFRIKRTIRRIVLSSTYRMASRTSDAMRRRADRVDPTNALLHRARIRRLQGEVIRDALLAVAGNLDTERFGPGVAVHLTPFMEGRGRPGRSGPQDGDRRRSIYLEVRRNFLAPMFLAFDTPVPFSTVGRRTVSNVPAQALTLLNDPFVQAQADVWAARVLAAEHGTPTQRVDAMYRRAFARPPRDVELGAALRFVGEQRAAYNGEDAERRAWADLAHVLFNVKEFVFVP